MPLTATRRPAPIAAIQAASALGSHSAGVAPGADQRSCGTADRAGDRLGVEAAIGRISVLGRQCRAQREAGHRRVGAVVGQGADQGVARPALGAVDERIAETPVGRVVQFRAGTRRRRNSPAARKSAACHRRRWAGWRSPRVDRPARPRCAGHGARRWRARRSPLPGEGLHGLRAAAHQHFDLAHGVARPARQAMSLSEPIQEGTEADALDLAGDPETAAGAQATSRVRIPLDHQILHAPSSETMHGPTGVRGVQAPP